MKKSIIISLLGFILISIISLYIIVYSNGHSYNIFSESFQKIGVIRVNSTPSNADVKINGIYKGKTPLSITDLLPGIYNIQVIKDGYSSWSNSVEIKGSDVSIINALLYKNSTKPILQSNNAIQDIYWGKNMYAYVTEMNSDDLAIYVHNFGYNFFNLGENTYYLIDKNSLSKDTSYKITNITFSDQSTNLLIELNSIEDKKYFIVSNSAKPTVIDLNSHIDLKPYNDVVLSRNDDSILLSNKDEIVSFNLKTYEKSTIFKNNDKYTFNRFYNTTNGIYISSYNKKNKLYDLLKVTVDSNNVKIIKEYTQEITNIIINKENNILAIEVGNINIDIYNLSSDNTSLIAIMNNANLISISNLKNENNILYKDQANYINSYSITDKTNKKINYNINKLKNIYWGTNSNILIFTKANLYNNFDLMYMNYDGSNINTLVKYISSSDIYIYNSRIYFLLKDSSSKNEKLYSVDIDGL